MYKDISSCRVCGNAHLVPVLDLGRLALTGFFPRRHNIKVEASPLELVKCGPHKGDVCCGLLQLRSSYIFKPDYFIRYGYRSGLNRLMARHLQRRAKEAAKKAALETDDLVVDIGSNDGTFLKAFDHKKFRLVGFDPAIKGFRRYYPPHIRIIDDFFSSCLYRREIKTKAKLVVSIAMFYNLESPLEFARQIYEILDDNGLWVFEQSYMPAMLKNTAYDAVCQEHLEYYALSQIKWIIDRAGFKIIDVEFNDMNGGSFCVTAAKAGSSRHKSYAGLGRLLMAEKAQRLDEPAPYKNFSGKVFAHRRLLRRKIHDIRKSHKRVIGYGASTKGNVILQFCGLSRADVDCIAEVNEDKFGCFTPGSLIPIVSEKEALDLRPDYLFILPWHFKREFLRKERKYLASGGALFFPLPEITIVTK